jgi:hypothetical protein
MNQCDCSFFGQIYVQSRQTGKEVRGGREEGRIKKQPCGEVMRSHHRLSRELQEEISEVLSIPL